MFILKLKNYIACFAVTTAAILGFGSSHASAQQALNLFGARAGQWEWRLHGGYDLPDHLWPARFFLSQYVEDLCATRGRGFAEVFAY